MYSFCYTLKSNEMYFFCYNYVSLFRLLIVEIIEVIYYARSIQKLRGQEGGRSVESPRPGWSRDEE